MRLYRILQAALCLLVIAFASHAKAQIQIPGKVINGTDKSAVPDASLQLLKSHSSAVSASRWLFPDQRFLYLIL